MSDRGKTYKASPIKGPILKYDINLHYKRYSFNVTLQILDEKIVKNITEKDSFASKIVDTAILNTFREVKYEPLVVCNQCVITFGIRKINLTLHHVSCRLYGKITSRNYRKRNEGYEV